MGEWKKSGCVLCAQNCGVELFVERGRITKVRGDRANPRSEGYVCRKGLHLAHYQHHADRLRVPLEKTANGFREVSWDYALGAIAERLGTIVREHGPRSFAYMGGGGQGCHFEAAFAVRLLRSLGSHYHYSALAQELTGMFWVQGRAVGRQHLPTIPDEEHTDLLLCVGWNPWMSHQMPQARKRIQAFAKDPNRLLVVIDPRRTETARRADIHLAIRPGADALLTKAMIAIVLEEGLQNREYIAQHTDHIDAAVSLFEGFDIPSAIRACELDEAAVRTVTRLFATRKSSIHADLGTLMGRHSTMTSYLQHLLLALCGRIGVRGGNVFPGRLMPLGAHSDERDERTWRTVATGYPAITGVFPPNVMPEEITAVGPDRLRAVLASGANPLRSYADTTAYETAFRQLDLLVTIDVAMSETARLSHYVLPARSAYEKWDGTFFAWSFPKTYFQLRRPVVEPEGEPWEESAILVEVARRLGVIPPVPDSLREAARGKRSGFALALMQYLQSEPRAMEMSPFVLAQTLGEVLGSANVAALWGLLQTAPAAVRQDAARLGFDPGVGFAEQLFQSLIERPEGMWIGESDPDANLSWVANRSRRIELLIPELADAVRALDAAGESIALQPDPRYPLILAAGRHTDDNANTLMRDPSWNEGRRSCTLAMHPHDAQKLRLQDKQAVRVETRAGAVECELELSEDAREGHVIMPHGFGLIYQGREIGANVNRLTPGANRDPIAGTPIHRYVHCRVEAAGPT